MHQSLSSFLRAATEAHFEGPIPAAERDRIRIVESAERAFDRSLSPLERSLKSLIHRLCATCCRTAPWWKPAGSCGPKRCRDAATDPPLYAAARGDAGGKRVLAGGEGAASWRSWRARERCSPEREEGKLAQRRLLRDAQPALGEQASCQCGAGSGLP